MQANNLLTRIFDRVLMVAAIIAAWMFFAVGVFVTIEVVGRYFLGSPTMWTEEISRLFQVWATMLAAGYLLRGRLNISVSAPAAKLGPRSRQALASFQLTFVAAIAVIGIWWGGEAVLDSVLRGTNTGSVLDVPLWLFEAPIPLGFSLLLIQCLREFVDVFQGKATLLGGE